MKDELIMDVLKSDHREVDNLFRKMEAASVENAQEVIFEKLADLLEVHTQGEEAVVYPRLEEIDELKSYARNSYEEHDEIEEMISELDSIDPSDKRWRAKSIELKEAVDHHVQEEENEIFPLMKKYFIEEELIEMANSMRGAKDKYQKAS